MTVRIVDSKTTFAKALTELKREKPERRTIEFHYNARRSNKDLPVIHVPEGTVLTIRTRSGIPSLKVGSGRVVFQAFSSWGNPIDVLGGQVHVCTDGCSRKVTIHIEPAEGLPDPVVTASPGEQGDGSRLYFHDPRLPRLPFLEYRSRRLPELETDTNDVPLAWLTPWPKSGVRPGTQRLPAATRRRSRSCGVSC
jgi:hypothetical protein